MFKCPPHSLLMHVMSLRSSGRELGILGTGGLEEEADADPRLVMLQHTHGTQSLPCVSPNHRSSHRSAVVVVVAAAITSLSPAGDNVTHRPRNFVTLNTRVTRV